MVPNVKGLEAWWTSVPRLQKEDIPIEKEMVGFKQSHASERSDSNKETLMKVEEKQLEIVIASFKSRRLAESGKGGRKKMVTTYFHLVPIFIFIVF